VELREGFYTPPERGRAAEAVLLNPREDAAVLVLLGEHDIANEKRLHAQLVSLIADHPLVVLDLSHVAFFDSSCLNLALRAQTSSRERAPTCAPTRCRPRLLRESVWLVLERDGEGVDDEVGVATLEELERASTITDSGGEDA
jgi:anti-anti-sigma factor